MDESQYVASRAMAVINHETFDFHDDGQHFEFDVTLGWYFVWCIEGETVDFDLVTAGIDRAHVQERYPDLDWEYAKTRDLEHPLLFVPWKGRHLLVDGWHRLAKAVLDGVTELPAFVLSENETDCIVREVV